MTATWISVLPPVFAILLALYLIASALAAYDAAPLPLHWIGIRLATAVAVMARPETIHLAAIAFAAGMLAWHHISARRAGAAA